MCTNLHGFFGFTQPFASIIITEHIVMQQEVLHMFK